MKKYKRFISKNILEKAYKMPENLDINDKNIENDEENIIDKVDKLPEEIFQVIGKVVSFVEVTDKFEGDKNENK